MAVCLCCSVWIVNFRKFPYICLISVPARFDSSRKNVSVRKGQNITLGCQAIGDKPISVSWYFHNQTMAHGKRGRWCSKKIFFYAKIWCYFPKLYERGPLPHPFTYINRDNIDIYCFFFRLKIHHHYQIISQAFWFNDKTFAMN